MSLITLPLAAAVLDDSGLLARQINAQYSSGDATTDITQKIIEAGVEVEGMIVNAAGEYGWPFTSGTVASAHPNYTSAQLTAYITRQDTLAGQAVKYKTLSALYLRSGQMGPQYIEQSKLYAIEAAKVLYGVEGTLDTGLLGQIGAVVLGQGVTSPDNTFSVQPRRVDGYARDAEPEFSRC